MVKGVFFVDNRELKKIGKKELLEILLSQAKRIEELENELNKTKKKLESKKVLIDECGNIADATTRLSKIFETAQETAELYLFNVKEKCKKIESDTKKECLVKTEKMIADTEAICKTREKDADEYLKKIKLEVKEITKKNKNSSNRKKESTSKKNDNKETSNNVKKKKTNSVKLDKVKKEI